jgi:hypothetical protein
METIPHPFQAAIRDAECVGSATHRTIGSIPTTRLDDKRFYIGFQPVWTFHGDSYTGNKKIRQASFFWLTGLTKSVTYNEQQPYGESYEEKKSCS